MKNKQLSKKLNLKVFFSHLFITLISLGLIISGICLVAIYYQQFSTYLFLVRTWNFWSGSTSPNFGTYLTNYNTSAATNEWDMASYIPFIAGIILGILGIITITAFSIITISKSKRRRK